MSIKSISSAALSLPIISCISSLIRRSYNVIQKNEQAADEAKGVAITATAGTIFGLFGSSVFMLATARFSIPSLLLYALIGLGAGTAVSSTVIYSFFSDLKKRENI